MAKETPCGESPAPAIVNQRYVGGPASWVIRKSTYDVVAFNSIIYDEFDVRRARVPPGVQRAT